MPVSYSQYLHRCRRRGSESQEGWGLRMRAEFRLKGCPRCGGDMYDDVDVYGAYVACLQCGRYICQARPPGCREGAMDLPPVMDMVIETQRQGRPRLKFN